MQNLSFDYLENICDGDQDCVGEIIDEFLKYSPKDLKDLLAARAKDNLPLYASILHKIKTPLLMFGAEKVKAEILSTEGKVKLCTDLRPLELELDSIEALVQTVISEMDAFRKST